MPGYCLGLITPPAMCRCPPPSPMEESAWRIAEPASTRGSRDLAESLNSGPLASTTTTKAISRKRSRKSASTERSSLSQSFPTSQASISRCTRQFASAFAMWGNWDTVRVVRTTSLASSRSPRKKSAQWASRSPGLTLRERKSVSSWMPARRAVADTGSGSSPASFQYDHTMEEQDP